MGKSQATSERLALVDIGSNAVRCVVARLDARPGFEVVLRRRVQTRLGASLNGELPAEGIAATLRAVRRFLRRVRRDYPRTRILALATAAVRDAPNRAALLEPLAKLGVGEVRILSGPEEGRLGAEAALRALPLEQGVIVDLGGGSLQATPVLGGKLGPSQSAPIGVARLTRRFLESDPVTAGQVAALRAEVADRLAALLPGRGSGVRVLASGGTVHALARLSMSRLPAGKAAPRTHGYELSLAELGALRRWLEPMPQRARASAPGVDPERSDVMLAGALVLEQLLEQSGYPALAACRSSVREGVLMEEAQKLAR